jgi:bifunctional non-homologous end joining protein LigD
MEGAHKAEQPALIKLQLATLTDTAPPGDQWLIEIKFDGYRALCRIEGEEVKVYTRAGNDWTAKWPAVAEDARRG